MNDNKRAADDAEREKFNAWFKSERTRIAVSPSFACKAWARAAWQAALSSRADGGKDSDRMDWLCERVINVRDPLPYGSRDMFWASPTDDDGGHEPSNLRAQIDAASAGEKK
jgi:hypothetical protein